MIETIFRVIIIVVLISITLGVIGSLSVTFDFSDNFSDVLFNFFAIACCLLPIKNLMPIFLFFVSIVVFKTTINIVKTIWNLLPISG